MSVKKGIIGETQNGLMKIFRHYLKSFQTQKPCDTKKCFYSLKHQTINQRELTRSSELKLTLWVSAVYVLSFICYVPTLLEQNGIIIPNGLLYLKYLYVCIPANQWYLVGLPELRLDGLEVRQE